MTYSQGYDDYFKGRGYNAETNIDWINGWIAAERFSRGNNLTREGVANPVWKR